MEIKQTTAEEAIREYIQEARKQGVPEKDIRKKFAKMNRRNKDVMGLVKEVLLEERISQNKKNLEKLKGGFNKKMPKKETEQYDEDFDLSQDEDDEDEDFEDEVVGTAKEKPKRKRVPKVNPNYFFDHNPEKIRLLDPVKKTVIFEGGNEMSVLLQMNARILQLLEEKL